MKKLAILMFAGLIAAAPAVWAEHGHGAGKSGCPLSEAKAGCDMPCCAEMRGDSSSHGCPIAGKFFKKAHFYLENQDAIGLSEEQVNTIKALKSEMKKAAVRQEADMKLGMMEMEDKLSAPVLDTEGLNKMIDDGMANMAVGAKASVATYGKLKAVLTADQTAKAKALWKQKK